MCLPHFLRLLNSTFQVSIPQTEDCSASKDGRADVCMQEQVGIGHLSVFLSDLKSDSKSLLMCFHTIEAQCQMYDFDVRKTYSGLF